MVLTLHYVSFIAYYLPSRILVSYLIIVIIIFIIIITIYKIYIFM